MITLNLPQFPFKIRTDGQSKQIFDGIRRKFVSLTPEEWVRQHFIQFLVNTKKYPASFLAIEKGLLVNNLQKRSDIVVYNRSRKPWMVVECKAPDVAISSETFYQAARYNLKLNVDFIVLTNGLTHFCLQTNKKELTFTEEIPVYEE